MNDQGNWSKANQPMFPKVPVGEISDKGLANLLVEVQMHAFESGFNVGDSLIEGIRSVRSALGATTPSNEEQVRRVESVLYESELSEADVQYWSQQIVAALTA